MRLGYDFLGFEPVCGVGLLGFPLWKTQNNLLHGPNSKDKIAEDNNLSERILWYMENKEFVLARGDQFMASIDVSRIHKMHT